MNSSTETVGSGSEPEPVADAIAERLAAQATARAERTERQRALRAELAAARTAGKTRGHAERLAHLERERVEIDRGRGWAVVAWQPRTTPPTRPAAPAPGRRPPTRKRR